MGDSNKFWNLVDTDRSTSNEKEAKPREKLIITALNYDCNGQLNLQIKPQTFYSGYESAIMSICDDLSIAL
jgi:hypothetical protein